MLVKVSRNLSREIQTGNVIEAESFQAQAPLLPALWRRRWVVLIVTILSLLVGAAYLLISTPIYTSSSSVYIEQNGAKILTDTQNFAAKSDTFLFTQAEIIKSTPVLSAALENADYHHLRTFENIRNPVASLQMGRDFRVEVGKKDDLLTVSVDSPYPEEAAEIVNKIVDVYLATQRTHKKSTAAEMLRVLQKEKDNRYAELTEKIGVMLKFKKENGALSFQSDKSNIILERLAKLSDTLTSLDLESYQSRSRYNIAKLMLEDRKKLEAFVEELQSRSSTGGDKQYEEIRSAVFKYRTMLFTLGQTHGQNSQSRQTINVTLRALEAELEDKQRAIAEAYVTQLGEQLKAVQANEDQVRDAFATQQKSAFDLNSKTAEYARLEDEVHRTEKQCDILDNRIKEVTVNGEDTGAMNVQVVEVGRVEEKPTRPRKSLTMAEALLVGLLLGTGLSLLWDRVDKRIRTPDEVRDLLGVADLGIVPQMLGRKSQMARGQYVQLQPSSAAAEAYRTIRTAIHFGATDGTKTLLITSAAAGEGKSTTASNLAIAFAQAGHRTLLLDADLRKPVQHKIFELESKEGVSSVVLGHKRLREVIQHTLVARLDVLPSGPILPNPSEIVASNRFAQIIKALTDGYDRVVIDSPPVMAVTDARILAASADATILVLRTNRSTRNGSRHALEALRSTGAKIIGVIINAMPQQSTQYAYGRYGASETNSNGDQRQDPGTHAVEPADAALGRLPEESLQLADTRSALSKEPQLSIED